MTACVCRAKTDEIAKLCINSRRAPPPSYPLKPNESLLPRRRKREQRRGERQRSEVDGGTIPAETAEAIVLLLRDNHTLCSTWSGSVYKKYVRVYDDHVHELRGSSSCFTHSSSPELHEFPDPIRPFHAIRDVVRRSRPLTEQHACFVVRCYRRRGDHVVIRSLRSSVTKGVPPRADVIPWSTESGPGGIITPSSAEVAVRSSLDGA
ncbi:hypothetical protein BHM03_00032585 [Ensete ventricosum]|nr:hypothetical protein BHM03_00032585 [Ensete ventricosum]